MSFLDKSLSRYRNRRRDSDDRHRNADQFLSVNDLNGATAVGQKGGLSRKRSRHESTHSGNGPFGTFGHQVILLVQLCPRLRFGFKILDGSKKMVQLIALKLWEIFY